MTWFRRASSWRDAECLSAALLAGVSLLAWGMPRLLPMGVRRCPLKTWTGVPCLTCGGTRAMDALLGGKMGEALRLQPLLTLLAVGALGWIIYALAGAGLRMPRLRVQFAVREKLLLVVVGCVCLAANWVYLIVDGR